MHMTLWYRIRFWICITFGHKRDPWGYYWVEDGQEHYRCRRCNRITTEPVVQP